MMAERVVPFPGAKAEAPVTEDSLAILLAREHGKNIRWCPQHGRWYIWNDRRWIPDETGQVFEMARNICRSFSIQTGKDKWGKHATVSSVERFGRTQPELVAQDSEWDANPNILGTPDGAVDLVTGKVIPAKRGLMATKAAAVSPSDEEPKLWLRFLHEACGGDDDLVCYLQRVCGYALTGDTSEQCLFFCFGPGKNGKSVFINTVGGILGDYAKTAAMDMLNASAESKHSTDLAMLRGARLVTASETDEGQSWSERRIKELTGRDKITARFMRQDNFTYRPEFKLLIVGNHKPVLTAVDDALRRRFNIVPFLTKPTSPNLRLEDDLRAEWPGILRWMIDGCLNWRSEGLDRPEAVERETAEYFDDQDLLAQWIEDSCVIQSGQWEYGQKLYESYIRFLDHAGERKMGRKSFTQAIRRKGFVPKHHSFANPRRSARIVLGLHLTGEPKSEAAE